MTHKVIACFARSGEDEMGCYPNLTVAEERRSRSHSPLRAASNDPHLSPVSLADFNLLKVLGKGSFGKVRMAFTLLKDSVFACRHVKLYDRF